MHNHSDHDHSHAPKNFNAAFAWAVGLNLSFTVIEAFYALYANSMSLLADAGHNLSDVLGLLLAWGAALLAKRGATPKYSYGFKRTTILAALANALFLVAASAIIAYEAVFKLFYPEALKENIVIWVALIGILINGGTALFFMRGRSSDLNIKGAFLHLAYDALISFAVVLGGIIILFTGWLRVDSIISLIIVGIIVGGTWGLLRDSVNLILDAVPHGIELKKISHYFISIPAIKGVHDLHVWALSTNEIALTAHLVMPEGELTDEHYKKINQDLKKNFNISHITIQIERGDVADPCALSDSC